MEATKWGRKMPVSLELRATVLRRRHGGDFTKRRDCEWNAARWLVVRRVSLLELWDKRLLQLILPTRVGDDDTPNAPTPSISLSLSQSTRANKRIG